MVCARTARPAGAHPEGRPRGLRALADLHRQPTVAEIAAKVGADEEDVLEALEAAGAYRATSLQTPWGADADSGDTLGDAIGHEECGFARAEDRATIEHVMRVITPREREVLRLRFAEDLTQAEIGERIGVSQMQVSRIIRQALGRLRSYATAQDGAHATRAALSGRSRAEHHRAPSLADEMTASCSPDVVRNYN